MLKKNTIVSVGPIQELNYQDYLIGFIEGDLSVPEKRLLERFLLRNPQANQELEKFRAARLYPDPEVVFPGKNKLKKYPFGIQAKKAMYYISGAAAIIFIAFMVIRPFRGEEPAMVESKQHVPQMIQDTLPPGDPMPEPLYAASLPQIPREKKIQPSGGTHTAVAFSMTPSDGAISAIRPIHRGIQYQLINTDFQPGGEIGLTKERNLYSQALPYLTESDRYLLSPHSSGKKKSNNAFGAVALGKIKEIFSGNPSNMKGLQNITLWTFADLGVAGLNQITNSDLHIQRIKNEEGTIIAYALVNEKHEITRMRMKNNTIRAENLK